MSQAASDPTTPAPLPGMATTPDGFVVFTLDDADGNSHRYEVRPHPATEGLDVMLALLALGAEPFASVVQSALAVEDVFAGAKIDEVLDIDLEALVGRIEWSKVGGDVKRSILSMPMSTLVRDVLRYTWRDGRELSNDVHFNGAYSRNYLELGRAVWEVSTANRFFPRFSTSKEGGAELARMPG